jgi:hypothetical protein
MDRAPNKFFRKPGKLCGATLDWWADHLVRRWRMSKTDARAEISAMVADGRLIEQPDA